MKEAELKQNSTPSLENRHLRESLRHISHVREDSSEIVLQ